LSEFWQVTCTHFERFLYRDSHSNFNTKEIIMRLTSQLAVLATLAASTLAAHAAPVTINFNTLGGGEGSTFTTYSESGFTVSAQSGSWFVASGGGSFGDPSPDIGAQPSGTLAVTDGGGLFNFDSLDLGIFSADGGAADYTITGFSGGTAVYTQMGSLSGSTAGTFVTLDGTDQSTSITSFTIALSGNPLGVNVDNIDLNTVPASVTPEPSTLALFGTGILGLAGAARRKFSR
jgi:PEP-CTERM motif